MPHLYRRVDVRIERCCERGAAPFVKGKRAAGRSGLRAWDGGRGPV
jgi:hypothetical protein